MFRIADGREHFYQWDLDRQVIVEDSSIVEVHFCNRTDECSLVVEVVDGLANVPNILLQKSFDIRVFGYDGKATRYDEVFKVKARTQPSDYVYTETVIKSVTELLEAAEQVNTITNEFYEFVDEYKMGLVDDGQGNVELKAVGSESGGTGDLSDYYTKDEVDALIEDIEIPEVDLTEYAKKSDIPTDYITSIPEEYITESELETKGYATEKYVDDAIAGIEIPDVASGDKHYELVFPADIGYEYKEACAFKDADTIECLNRINAGELPSCSINGYTVIGAEPTGSYGMDRFYLYTIDPPTNTFSFVISEWCVNKSAEGWIYWSKFSINRTFYTKTSQLTNDSDFTTKAYVDGLFEGIATAEGGSY